MADTEQESNQKRRGNPEWTKGRSGNPGGRPKVAIAWKERCRQFLEEEGGWDNLTDIVKMRRSEPSAALGALRLMAEYAYGKPQQSMDLTSGGQSLVKVISGVDVNQACP